MNKLLSVYPIANGDELNVFSSEPPVTIKIMDMEGTVIIGPMEYDLKHKHINIKPLPSATYIVEVTFVNNKTSRSLFVKI